MPLITDFHVHSKYSRACSKSLDMPHLNAWAQLKGIDVLSAGDFTHPKWFAELHEGLEEAEKGLYVLRDTQGKLSGRNGAMTMMPVPESCRREVRFILATEISLIYKKNGRVRKIHHLIVAPNLATAARINIELEKRGNIRSDGRPILGLDSKLLLQLLLDISPDIQLIPAHIWTPHFAILGSQSGFDSIEECFEELSPHITALETGLSSDPSMNWRVSSLDRFALISSSDAHSLPKLGREATLFDTERNYPAILHALRHDHSQIAGTFEFFPEEGKYHADGLRNEGLCLLPDETVAHGYVSPKTGNKITVGVLHRVSKLADRPTGFRPETARPFWNMVPLIEIIAEVLGMTVASKKVEALYFALLRELGPEFSILATVPVEEITRAETRGAVPAGRVAEAIRRMRAGEVVVKPGYDGEYGVVKIFAEDELKREHQGALF